MIKRNKLYRVPSGRIARALGAVAVAAALVLTPGSAAEAQEVRRGGSATQAEWIAVQSLDPHLSSTVNSLVWPNLFDSLFSYRAPAGPGDSYEIGPMLVDSHSVVSDDGRVIELRLRPGVTFHDGSVLTADVVRWNLERARDHAQSTRRQAVDGLREIEVVDDLTLRLSFTAPQPLLGLLFSQANPANVFIVSRQAVETMGETAFARTPVGSGPFRLVEWRQDDRLELARFEGYSFAGSDGAPLPYLDRAAIRFILDRSVATLELRAGAVDIAEPLAQDTVALRGARNIELYRVPYTDRAFPAFYISSNPELGSPFAADVRLRRAVHHAINRDAMAAVLGFGIGEPHYYFGWFPGVPGYDDSITRYSYDPDRARALLAEAGHAGGIDLEVKVINRPGDVQPLEVMQAMLAEVGINLVINLMDRTPWVDAGRSGNFEALSHGNTADIEPLMRRQSFSTSSSNWAGYSNAEVDALWEAAAATSEAEERIAIYRQIQEIMAQDAFHVIAYRVPTYFAHTSRLRGIEVTGGLGLAHVWVTN